MAEDQDFQSLDEADEALLADKYYKSFSSEHASTLPAEQPAYK